MQSAIDRPRNLFAYRDSPPLHELAAAYCFGIIRNHPFIDGNKRAGILSSAVFLDLNGYALRPDERAPSISSSLSPPAKSTKAFSPPGSPTSRRARRDRGTARGRIAPGASIDTQMDGATGETRPPTPLPETEFDRYGNSVSY